MYECLDFLPAILLMIYCSLAISGLHNANWYSICTDDLYPTVVLKKPNMEAVDTPVDLQYMCGFQTSGRSSQHNC